MFDLYQAPETAAHRQADLLNQVAADRLARSASEGSETSANESPSPTRRLSVLAADVFAAISAAVSVATRRPRWS